ncbi:hypothetical protein S83_029275, partial [Arachis hypogaea]
MHLKSIRLDFPDFLCVRLEIFNVIISRLDLLIVNSCVFGFNHSSEDCNKKFSLIFLSFSRIQ